MNTYQILLDMDTHVRHYELTGKHSTDNPTAVARIELVGKVQNLLQEPGSREYKIHSTGITGEFDEIKLVNKFNSNESVNIRFATPDYEPLKSRFRATLRDYTPEHEEQYKKLFDFLCSNGFEKPDALTNFMGNSWLVFQNARANIPGEHNNVAVFISIKPLPLPTR